MPTAAKPKCVQWNRESGQNWSDWKSALQSVLGAARTPANPWNYTQKFIYRPVKQLQKVSHSPQLQHLHQSLSETARHEIPVEGHDVHHYETTGDTKRVKKVRKDICPENCWFDQSRLSRYKLKVWCWRETAAVVQGGFWQTGQEVLTRHRSVWPVRYSLVLMRGIHVYENKWQNDGRVVIQMKPELSVIALLLCVHQLPASWRVVRTAAQETSLTTMSLKEKHRFSCHK